MTFLEKLIRVARLHNSLFKQISTLLAPVLDVAIRVFLFNVFFTSGWLKFENALNGRWEATQMLFQYEHPIPGLSPEFAAVFGTGAELICACLLLIGLASRYAALVLIGMTIVIDLTYVHSMEHMIWLLFLTHIFLRSAGTLSLDCLFACKFNRGPSVNYVMKS